MPGEDGWSGRGSDSAAVAWAARLLIGTVTGLAAKPSRWGIMPGNDVHGMSRNRTLW